MSNILNAVEQSAETGEPVRVEGTDAIADAVDLVDEGLATVSVGDNGCAVHTGSDPYDRPFKVILSDAYPHEISYV